VTELHPTLNTLLTRASAAKLSEPAPTPEHLELMFRAAANAPDHGRLRPWRYIVVKSAERARFGELLANTLKSSDPAATPDMLQRERDKAMRAPLLVVAAVKVNTSGKIPVVEQALAVAASIENLLIAAHALGYGTMWKTGAPAYDSGLKAALGLAAEDQIAGMLYLGTNNGRTMDRDIRLEGVVSEF